MGPTEQLRVDPTNVEQARAWGGDEGDYWARHAAQFDTGIARYHRLFMDAAGIGERDVVLDLGCGTGLTTRDAARRASRGSALGVDLSARMLEVARTQAEQEGLTNADFLQADAQVHPFPPESFDVAISRAGAMFFGDPAAAFANIARALRSGGRVVLLVWQGPERNEWIRLIVGALAAGRDLAPPPPGAQGPFALSEPDRVRRLLGGAGFTEQHLEPLHEPLNFGPTAAEATDFMHGLNAWMLRDLDENDARGALDDLAEVMRSHETPDGVLLDSAAWLVTATRAP